MQQKHLIYKEKDYSVYCMNAGEFKDPAFFRAVYSSVSQRRREKTDRLCFEKDKRLSLAAEYLLMEAMDDFALNYNDTSIIEDKNGKPLFEKLPFYFSLSHSEEKALCIFGKAPAGCDIEFIRRGIEFEKSDYKAIAEEYFSSEENKQIAGGKDGNEKLDLFFTLWTLKESIFKMTGKWDGKYNAHSIISDGYALTWVALND